MTTEISVMYGSEKVNIHSMGYLCDVNFHSRSSKFARVAIPLGHNWKDLSSKLIVCFIKTVAMGVIYVFVLCKRLCLLRR